MTNRPTTKGELAAKLRGYITDLEMYRDVPDAFDVESDHDYAEFILESAADDARHAGMRSLVEVIEGRVRATDALETLGKALEAITDVDQPRPDWLSLKAAASYLGMSTSGLRKIVDRSRKGIAPVINFSQPHKGASIKFRVEWLDEYQEQREALRVAPERRRPKRSQLLVEDHF